LKVLVSNDDGYLAKGLNCLVDHLVAAGIDVVVFAPNDEQSGQGMAITLRTPVKVERISSNVYSVHGTPVDCVNLAQTSGLIDGVDILVSGINHGRNLGDDTLYSGTVAAALEARHLPLPSIACSVDAASPKHFETAAKLIVQLVQQIKDWPREQVDVLNLNVPDIPYADMNGFELTQLSTRELSLSADVKRLNSDVVECMIGGVGAFVVTDSIADGKENEPSELRYDYQALADNFASLTAIKAQLKQPENLATSLIDKLNT